ncbi:GNAT family N-acetyltransferase [Providencia stuartii]|uniref:GNAT family N-acetyltransferase n=1 Tax=Providencia manganoxydans TaxID=2923283 RepID=A0ABX7ABC7_9GAMM|nr:MULTISPECIES: GNAT family N-acetyltransferase [Providencia]ELR5300464.1 GNAT family N-acetyltransferase [Providencia stuartii]MDW7588099.1 GNAT family N-acetyltransferase [Providencia sp. 2023EL-00965]MDX4946367.1 GNAT family N-acetyltransferase [Providencia manganoxydans]QQO61253.1 GNAT family N-acetyltransferase [Providencia manganoxydans]HEF8773451.1 GNAT family N-acetyltransferase [Providencia stuartii]
MSIIELETPRLRLRGWTEQDKPAFFKMNSSTEVMRYFPSVLDKAQSDHLMSQIMARFDSQGGWGLWAVELKLTGELIGFVGLNIPRYLFPFSPCTEIGWRLRAEYWRQGYTTEAAQVVIKFAFEQLKLKELVAFTAVSNTPSEAVMKKLGMHKDAEHFNHPALPEGHWLSEHVLYRLQNPEIES